MVVLSILWSAISHRLIEVALELEEDEVLIFDVIPYDDDDPPPPPPPDVVVTIGVETITFTIRVIGSALFPAPSVTL